MVESLTPWTMLFTHVVKLTCASAILALDVVVYTQRKEKYSLVGLGLDVSFLYVKSPLQIPTICCAVLHQKHTDTVAALPQLR
jgi:hypothetical protein